MRDARIDPRVERGRVRSGDPCGARSDRIPVVEGPRPRSKWMGSSPEFGLVAMVGNG